MIIFIGNSQLTYIALMKFNNIMRKYVCENHPHENSAELAANIPKTITSSVTDRNIAHF